VKGTTADIKTKILARRNLDETKKKGGVGERRL
jgi:hypothetical protein